MYTNVCKHTLFNIYFYVFFFNEYIYERSFIIIEKNFKLNDKCTIFIIEYLNV